MEQKEKKLNSIEKTFEVLLSFLNVGHSLGVRELAAKLNVSPGTIQRIVKISKNYGFLDQDPLTNRYQLGTIYFNFFNLLQNNFPITRIAHPVMEKLSYKINETVNLYIIRDKSSLCIDSVQAAQDLKATKDIGSSGPLYAGASSKCLLAFCSRNFIEDYLREEKLTQFTKNTLTNKVKLYKELEDIKRRGYAKSIEERTPGLASFSAPIFDHTGWLAAAISVDIPEIRFRNKNHRKVCLQEMLWATEYISKSMGYSKSSSKN
jgi:DNA-binding IclR family transcriptional regulator